MRKIVLLLLWSSMGLVYPVFGEGISDEIFYLNQENHLSINEDNFNKLKQEGSSALIKILEESKEDQPINTIMGKFIVSTPAKSEIMLKLAEFADQRAREIVEWYMEHSPDRFCRQIAAVSLGSVGDKTSIEKLKAVLRDIDPALKLYAARALGELGDSAGYDTALQYLKSEDATLKIQAMYALAMISREGAIPFLTAEMAHQDYRDVAKLAISKIEYDHLSPKKKPGYLRKMLKHESGETVYWAAREFMKLGDQYVAELSKIVKPGKYPGRDLIRNALEAKGINVENKK
ncbi:MAG: HEAT repeat domain-containing protein [Elusimicrobia bacterium]|nr:HEAT repeat domain-containing protein [Elusimicrobiota bacterium]